MLTDLWVMPKGMKRSGVAGPKSPEWISKYGSVVAVPYGVASADGMNEKGLVTNLLYLVESEYGDLGDKPPMAISLWAQYVLDHFASVKEAVEHLKNEPFRIVPATIPNGRPASLHLSISDSSGDSAIFEYVNGKLVIHHGRHYKVMTNSPTFDEQLALNSYWKLIGGLTFIPGTNRAADRFARASFLINAVPKEPHPSYIHAVPDSRFDYQAVASTLSVMRSVSVPLGITTPDQPNISSTIWRSISDQKNMIYYFDSATMPNTFWVEFKDLDFSANAPVRRLSVAGGVIHSGNTASQFEVCEPFKFLKPN